VYIVEAGWNVCIFNNYYDGKEFPLFIIMEINLLELKQCEENIYAGYCAISFCFQCNNPLTKEAKLTAAMRIVSEWKDYDLEIKTLQNKININQTDEEREFISERSTTWKPGE
jgi:hypothetical protein